MTSQIYLIDYYSNSIDSIMHRCSVFIKIFFTFIFLIIIILSKNPLQFALYLAILIGLILLAKLPLMRLLKWAAYPVVFGMIFSVSQFFYSYQLAIVTILRVITSVLLMLLFVNTTGFIPLFTLIPSKTLRNTFLLTYRFFFMIIDTFTKRIEILTIRGIGKASALRKINAISSTVGHGLIHTIEKAERVYRIMLIRGFSGRMGMHKNTAINKYDIILIILLLGVIAIWRI